MNIRKEQGMAQQRMNVQAPIERLFAERWSTRAFDPDKPVEREHLSSCLEAARWAPSCFGEEPWHFVVANRFEDESVWQQTLNCLAPKNQIWAKNAPLLIIAAAHPVFSKNGNANRWAEYDTGQAVICLCLQAETLGLVSHQMGGFDPEAIKAELRIPESLHIMSVAALGYAGDIGMLDDDFQSVETAPRTRKSLAEIVHNGRWNSAWQPPANAGWEARYQETAVEKLPWFHKALDADFKQALEQLAIKECDVLDIGCGPGTQSVALAKLGFSVTASDVSESAVASASQLATEEGVPIEFHIDDVLDSQLSGSFDLILDRGIFHCFSDTADQQAYLGTIRRLLKPDGILLLKCFHKDETSEMGPPGRYDEADIRNFFADGFELVEARASQLVSDTLDTPPKALFCVLKRSKE